MPFERISRIIGRTNELHTIVFHEALRTEFRIIGDEIVTLVVDGTRGLGIQTLLDTESGLEL